MVWLVRPKKNISKRKQQSIIDRKCALTYTGWWIEIEEIVYRSGERKLFGDVELNERLVGETVVCYVPKKWLIIRCGGESALVFWKFDGHHEVIRHPKIFVDGLLKVLDLLVFVEG